MLVFFACTPKKESKIPSTDVFSDTASYEVFGAPIENKEALSKEDMLKKYEQLSPGDTLQVTFQSSIQEVCQKKGCWMTLDLGNQKESFVKFTDYGFFVPKNAQRHEVVVSGKAFINEISVDEQKHYALDAGAAPASIDSITQPKRTYMFQADGVRIAK